MDIVICFFTIHLASLLRRRCSRADASILIPPAPGEAEPPRARRLPRPRRPPSSPSLFSPHPTCCRMAALAAASCGSCAPMPQRHAPFCCSACPSPPSRTRVLGRQKRHKKKKGGGKSIRFPMAAAARRRSLLARGRRLGATSTKG